MMLSILDYYLVPYALFLGASAVEVGVLIALPHLLAAVSQVFAVRVVRSAGSRLRFLVRGTAIQASTLLPAALLAVLPLNGRVYWLTACIVAFRVVGNFVGAAWGSLVSDYLPPEKRGKYFGWRSQVIGVAGVCGIVLSGLLLWGMDRVHAVLGFGLLFLCAALCRFISFGFMTRMVDIPSHYQPGSDFTFLMFLRRFRQSNFVKFVLYVASITFATQLSAAFFGVYMLRDLGFSYITYMMLQLVPVTAGLVAFPIWGRHADVVGNARILKLTSMIVPFIPVFWIFFKSPWWLVPVEIVGGFAWGGFNLCAVNFIYDAVSPAKRVRCLAYFNLINGTAIFAGAMTGGLLADRLPPLFSNRLLSLFLLSAVLRLAAHFFLSKRFEEVRHSARRVSSKDVFFSVVGIRPLSGVGHDGIS